MTRRLPDEVQPAVRALSGEGYLWSCTRLSGVTCRVCCTPTAGAAVCTACAAHIASPHPTADIVGTFVYAPFGSQSYHLVKSYKSDNPGPTQPKIMATLLGVGLRGHRDCLMHLSGSSDLRWAVVPSTRRPRPDQPLRTVVLTFANPARETRLAARPGLEDPRAFDPTHFAVPPGQTMSDSVVLIDDSWVRGGHAQSAAAALKLRGVRHVAVFSAARVLAPDWPPTAEFLRARAGDRTFEPARCPWTFGECP